MPTKHALVQLDWAKDASGAWPSLQELDLSNPSLAGSEGVFVIWHGGSRPQVLRVGHGLLSERLVEERVNPDVQVFTMFGLFVTWAKAPPVCLGGIEAYLAYLLWPIIEHEVPDEPPLAVNLPW